MADLFENAPTDIELAQVDGPTSRWPTTLAELVDVLRCVAVRRGRSEEEAIADAQQGALAIGEYLGGRQIYLPFGDRLKAALRDRRLYLEYNGRNKAELAARYDITERRVEQIAAEQRAIHIERLQGKLFKD